MNTPLSGTGSKITFLLLLIKNDLETRGAICAVQKNEVPVAHCCNRVSNVFRIEMKARDEMNCPKKLDNLSVKIIQAAERGLLFRTAGGKPFDLPLSSPKNSQSVSK